jgi:hypothetical protein
LVSSSVHACDKTESPCKNEGVCEKSGDEFVCKCTEDWIGDTCAIKGKTNLFLTKILYFPNSSYLIQAELTLFIVDSSISSKPLSLEVQ